MTKPRPITVLIVDDHAVVREGIRAVLQADPGFVVAGEAGSAAQALQVAAAAQPDVVLLDISMPGGSGLDAVPDLIAAAPRARVLMLSVHEDGEYVMRSVRAGAHGYLRKDTGPAELRSAARAVSAGAGFFSPVVAATLATAIRGEGAASAAATRPSAQGLTAREREVLALVAGGLLNKEIGARLRISVRTVEAHRDNLMRKLGIRSAATLTRFALEAGLTVPRAD